jgi:hypothetical protein
VAARPAAANVARPVVHPGMGTESWLAALANAAAVRPAGGCPPADAVALAAVLGGFFGGIYAYRLVWVAWLLVARRGRPRRRARRMRWIALGIGGAVALAIAAGIELAAR